MPRNKYPEETEQKILDAALKLFIEKGYEQTTILDIVGEMGGLTRGAFYHHFKSKDEVLLALSTKLFVDMDPFEKAKQKSDMNGLQKVRWVLTQFNTKSDYYSLQMEILPLFNSPAMLKLLIDINRDNTSPRFAELIKEGIEDGSIKAANAKLVAELFMLLVNLWMVPTIYPYEEEQEAWQKFEMVKGICTAIGFPIFDEELTHLLEENAND